MILCLCHGVSDRTVKRHVAEGAQTMSEVGRRCRAGTDCGMCRKDLYKLVKRCRDELDLAAK